jgi:DNA topoisomerase-1
LENNIPAILREVNPKIKDVKIKKYDDEKTGSYIEFMDEKSAEAIKNSLGNDYKVYKIDDARIRLINPKLPYKTSTLQQDAINKTG